MDLCYLEHQIKPYIRTIPDTYLLTQEVFSQHIFNPFAGIKCGEDIGNPTFTYLTIYQPASKCRMWAEKFVFLVAKIMDRHRQEEPHIGCAGRGPENENYWPLPHLLPNKQLLRLVRLLPVYCCCCLPSCLCFKSMVKIRKNKFKTIYIELQRD